jgi:hypothetical protein
MTPVSLKSLFAASMLLSTALTPAHAADKPPMTVDQPSTMTTQSKISATIEFSLSALDRSLERKVPRRLATFNDRTTSCWHRRVLGRMVNINCEYSGYVERTGGVSLRAEDGRLVATTPLFGTVSARGLRGLAALVHGDAEGAMTVVATARPQLRPDWSFALDMREGFRWTEAPTLSVLGFHINLTRFVEPKIRSQLARVQAEALAGARALDLRGKAAAAWDHAFKTVQIADTPQVWLQTTPQSVSFAGLRAHGDVLSGSIEIAGTTATSVGSEPPAPTPTPLPRLGRDVTEPGKFAIMLPVTVKYDAVRDQIRDFMAAHANNDGPVLRDIDIYPSGGKLVIGLRVANTQEATDAGGWVYLTATLQVDADNRVVAFPDITVQDSTSSPTSVAAMVRDPAFIQALRDKVRVGYDTEVQKAIASANARLTRPLGGGFRSEGKLASAGVGDVRLLADGLTINLRASGQLKILYGL